MLATPTNDLVERVARALASFRSTEHDWERYEPKARAAVRLALEEAAKACEAELVGSFDQYSLGYNDGCKENAAAIRAMIPTGNAPAQDDPGNAE